MRGLIGAAVVAVAVVLQLAVADRITFPGGTGPDLVLLTVAALALAIGPMAGAILGFCAGLALDVAPPAGHLVGQDALVFCLIGYVCGLIAVGPAAEGLPEQERSALFELGITAAGAVCGEAMTAGLGVMLSDPRVTWPAVKHVLPVAAGYDLLLSPFVLFTVAAMLRVAGFVSPRDASAGRAVRPAAWAARPPAAGSVRQVTGGGSPRLRLSGQGKGGDGWVGRGSAGGNRSGPGRSGLSGPGNSRPGAGRREPRLKLGGSGGTARSGGKTSPGLGPGRVRFASRRGEGVVGGSLLGSGGARRSAGTGRSVGFRRAGDKLASSRFGASLLGGSVFGRSSSPFGRSMSPFGRSSAAFGGSVGLTGRMGSSASGFTGKSLRTRSKGGGGPSKSGGRAPRFRKENVFARAARDGRRPAQRKSPGKRWLRGSRPGRGPVRSLAGSGLGRRSPGRGWLRGSGSGAPRSGGLGRSSGGLGRSSGGLGRSSGGLGRSSGGLGRSSGGLGGGRKGGLGGRSPFGRKSAFGGTGGTSAASRKSGIRGKSLRIGKSGGSSRIRAGRPKKSWRRSGGYR